jgi:hypothetical protein
VGTLSIPRYLHCSLVISPVSRSGTTSTSAHGTIQAVDLICFGGLSKQQCVYDHKIYQGRCEINSSDRSAKWSDYVLQSSSAPAATASNRDRLLSDSSAIGVTAITANGNIFIFGGDSRFEIPKVRGYFTPDAKAFIDTNFLSPREDSVADASDRGGGAGRSMNDFANNDNDNDSISYSISKVSISK